MWKKKKEEKFIYLATTNQILSVLLSAGIYIHQNPFQSPIQSACSSDFHCIFAPIHSPYLPECVRVSGVEADLYITSLSACLCKLLWLRRSLCVFCRFWLLDQTRAQDSNSLSLLTDMSGVEALVSLFSGLPLWSMEEHSGKLPDGRRVETCCSLKRKKKRSV